MKMYELGATQYTYLGLKKAIKELAPELSLPTSEDRFTEDTIAFLADKGIVVTVVDVEPQEPEEPELTLEELKQQKEAEIANARWRAETAGVTLHGMHIATDRESQALINGAVTRTLLDPNYSTAWKTKDGFVQLNAQTIQFVGAKVAEHVESCFTIEGRLYMQIQAATTKEAVEAIVWPEVEADA